MAHDFEWIIRDWAAIVGADGVAKIEQTDFLRRSHLNEDDDWMALARAWGARQSPPIEVGMLQDQFGVVLRKSK